MNVFDLAARITLDQSEYNQGLRDAGSNMKGFGEKLKKGLKTAAKVGGAAIAAFSAAATAIGKQSIESYAQYEQLVGGVETLFGAQGKSLEEYAASVGKTADGVKAKYDNLIAAQSMVMNNANNAYKTMGMSANEYMETVTGFAAALNQSLGGNTKKAAEYADRAITDMADNASKMGTSMESIQAAYSGFSKQNYTMLDNLKLGYGGTKTEMERLITDAENLNSSFKATRDANGDLTMSYADIVDAIHIVQDNMGIAENAAAEASKTISGSLSAAKASYKNLITGLADEGADLDKLLGNFIDSVVTAGDNLLPRIEKVLNTLAGIIPVAINKIFPIINKVIIKNLPTFIDGGTQLLVTLITGIVQALPQLVAMIPQIISTIWNALKESWPQLKEAGIQLLAMIMVGMSNGLAAGLGAIVNLVSKLWEKVKKATVKKWTDIKSAVSKKWDEIKSNAAAKVDTIKSSITSKWEAIKSAVTAKVEGMKAKVSSTFESMREKIKGIIDKIKGFFNFTFEIPKIKLPHFKIVPEGWVLGDLLKGIKPELSIVWYKKAYENPYMFTKPTVMGFGDGNGGEIVYGHENLMRDIRKAVGAGAAQVTINVYPSPGMNETKLAKKIEQILVAEQKQRERAYA